jgi:hypothetical protein
VYLKRDFLLFVSFLFFCVVLVKRYKIHVEEEEKKEEDRTNEKKKKAKKKKNVLTRIYRSTRYEVRRRRIKWMDGWMDG